MRRFLLLLILSLVLPRPTPARQASALETLANSLAPGEWGLLNVDGDASGWGTGLLHDGAGILGITGYAQKMAYDSERNRVYFSGGEHDGLTKTIYYDVATGQWVEADVLDSMVCQYGHAYDTNAIWPAHGELYASSTLIANARKIDLDDITDPDCGIAQPSGFYETEPSIEYFPERDELLWLQGGRLGGVKKYNRVSNSWSNVTTSLPDLEIRGAIARYVPSIRAVLFMGGIDTDPATDVVSRAVYKYDEDGVVTRLGDMPSSIAIFQNYHLAVVDPATSKLLVIVAVINPGGEFGTEGAFAGENEFWEYDPLTDTWTELSMAGVPDPEEWWIPSVGSTGSYPFGVTATPIPEFGVIMFASPVITAMGRESRVYIYKHGDDVGGGSSFATKCAQAGVIGCFDFDARSDVRHIPSGTFPMIYGWDSGTESACNSAGLGTNTPVFTIAGVSGAMNTAPKVQDGACVFPDIDTSVKFGGAGSLKIQVPSESDGATGGWFDSTFTGHNESIVRVGPDNGGQLYMQFKYRTQNMVQDFGGAMGAFPNSFVKMLILGGRPPGLDFLGSDWTLADDLIFAAGFTGNRNGLFQAYTYSEPDGLYSAERNLSGTIYLQTGSSCEYSGSDGYSYPPCVRLVDETWHEVTLHVQLVPHPTLFTIVGNVIGSAGTFTESQVVGRTVYIVGKGFFEVTELVTANAFRLDGSPGDSSGNTVYISNWPNSVFQLWIDGTLVIDNDDQPQVWDIDDAGWGQFRLQPHMTSKDNTKSHTPGTVWYDNFVISTNAIEFGDADEPAPVVTSGRLRFRR